MSVMTTSEEGDNRLRERIRLAPASRSTAGPEQAYIYWAMTADSSIIDARAVSETETISRTLTVYDGHAFIGGGRLLPDTMIVKEHGESTAGVEDTDYTVDYTDDLLTILDGLDWNPIGYCDARREKDDGFQGFEGYFHGNGHKVTGFRLREELPCRGFFGLVTNGGIDGLTLVPEGVITGTDRVGILAGQVTNLRSKTAGQKGKLRRKETQEVLWELRRSAFWKIVWRMWS